MYLQFDEKLLSIGELDGLKVESVSTFEGDCELGMRKAKFVNLYESGQQQINQQNHDD
jgi:activator of HSP90 ATPase